MSDMGTWYQCPCYKKKRLENTFRSYPVSQHILVVPTFFIAKFYDSTIQKVVEVCQFLDLKRKNIFLQTLVLKIFV